LKGLRKKVDYSEHGGAPLLGVDGVCVVCHGKSNGKAISNAIKFAQQSVNKNVNNEITQELAKLENGVK
jgi:glycerol-3-phosphate acyltransferase PlsX